MASDLILPPVDIRPFQPHNLALRKFRASLGDRGANPVDVLIVGDSLVELGATGVATTDVTTRWIERWVRQVSSDLGMGYGMYYPIVQGAVITRQTNDPWATSGGLTLYTFSLYWGLGSRAWLATVGSDTATLTFYGDRVTVLYTTLVNTSAGVEFVLDGAVVDTVDMQAATAYGVQWDSGQLEMGNHTLVLRYPGGVRDENFIIEGAMVEVGPRPNVFRVWDCSQSGYGAVNFADAANTFENSLSGIDPDLVIVALGANDKTIGRTVTQVVNDTVTVVNKVQGFASPDASVALMVEWGKGTEGAGTWDPYAVALRALAKSNNWQLIDLHAAAGPLQTDTYSLTTDQVHGNQKGNRFTANLTSASLFGDPKDGTQWVQNGNNIGSPKGFVGVGTTSPIYKMDVRNTSADSQLHFSSDDTDGGGYLTSASASNFFMSAGAAYEESGGGFRAKDIFSTIIGGQLGFLQFLSGTSLTPGNTFTPAELLFVTPYGTLSANAPTINAQPGVATWIALPANVGIAAPAFTTRSAGTKFILYPAVTGSTTDMAMGVDSNVFWFSHFAATSTQLFKWYGGTTEIMRLTGDGDLGIRAGTSSTLAKVGGTLSVNTTTVGNVGTGEDDLMSYAIPANTLATDKDRVTFEAVGTFLGSANTKTLKVKYGATTLFDSTALAIASDADWALTGYIIRTGAATQKCVVAFRSSSAVLATYTDYTPATETLSGAVTLKLTGEATANNEVVQQIMTVDWKSAP